MPKSPPVENHCSQCFWYRDGVFYFIDAAFTNKHDFHTAVPVQQEKTAAGEWKTYGGITVKNIENDGEMSVYATAGYRGALVMAVASGSEEEKRGILVSDVIVSWGSKVIDCIHDLEGCILSPDQFVSVIRKQVTITL